MTDGGSIEIHSPGTCRELLLLGREEESDGRMIATGTALEAGNLVCSYC